MAAKMVHVIALSPFFDRAEGISRKAGEEFDVTEERMQQLNACGPEQGGARLVNECPKEPLSPAGKQAARKARAKKETE